MKVFVCIFTHKIKGSVYFIQESADAPVLIRGILSSNCIRERSHKAIHIHEFGDLSLGCRTCGDHWNTTSYPHGGLHDHRSHSGDLGNILFSSKGISKIHMETNKLTLYGKHSILGRSLIIHEGKDDLGRRNTYESRTTGTSGKRMDCGVIGIAHTNILQHYTNL